MIEVASVANVALCAIFGLLCVLVISQSRKDVERARKGVRRDVRQARRDSYLLGRAKVSDMEDAERAQRKALLQILQSMASMLEQQRLAIASVAKKQSDAELPPTTAGIPPIHPDGEYERPTNGASILPRMSR